MHGEFVLGSILGGAKALERRKYDAVVAIGSLHHSGMLELAIANAIDYLNPGGRVLIMVYNKFSIYNILHSPINCLKSYVGHTLNGTNSWKELSEVVRAVNDSNGVGEGAPTTEYSHRKIFSGSKVVWKTELRNLNDLLLPRGHTVSRDTLLNNVGRLAGTDIYALGTKR